MAAETAIEQNHQIRGIGRILSSGNNERIPNAAGTVNSSCSLRPISVSPAAASPIQITKGDTVAKASAPSPRIPVRPPGNHETTTRRSAAISAGNKKYGLRPGRIAAVTTASAANHNQIDGPAVWASAHRDRSSATLHTPNASEILIQNG